MKLLVALAIVVAPLTIAATSSAAPAAGCPASKDLLSIEETLNRVDFTIYDADTETAVRQLIADLDENGNRDGFLCSKQFKPNRGQGQLGGVGYVITQISDNQPTGRL